MRALCTRIPVLAALSFLLAACGGMDVESEPGPAYTIEVHNPMTHPMIISYTDATGTHLLGTVSAESSGRFVITTPSSLDIVVTATDEAQAETVTRNVTLQPGTVTEVMLGEGTEERPEP